MLQFMAVELELQSSLSDIGTFCTFHCHFGHFGIFSAINYCTHLPVNLQICIHTDLKPITSRPAVQVANLKLEHDRN